MKTLANKFFYLTLILSFSCHALPEDAQKEAVLSANTADINQQTHKGEYMGEVQFDQGTRHLRAAKAITEGDNQNKITLAIAYGDKKELAHYWELTAVDKPPLHAYGDEIRYYPQKHLVELIGKAKVIQGNNSFSAPKITYDTVKQHITTIPDKQNRTIIILHPEKKV